MSADDPDGFCAVEAPHVDCEVPACDGEPPSGEHELSSIGIDLPSSPAAYVTYTFDLENPEGERRLRECLDAPKVKSALWEFDQWLRNQLKHYDRDDAEGLQAARDALWTVFTEHGVDLDDE